MQVSDGVYQLHANTAGGRVKFATNSGKIAIRAYMPNMFKMSHYALTGRVTAYRRFREGCHRLEASAQSISANDTPEHPHFAAACLRYRAVEMDFRPKVGWHREYFAPADGTEVIFLPAFPI